MNSIKAVLCDWPWILLREYGEDTLPDTYYHAKDLFGEDYDKMRYMSKLAGHIHAIIQVYHNPHTNKWYGEFGDEIDIYDYVEPSDVHLFKNDGGYRWADCVYDPGTIVEMIPGDDVDDDVFFSDIVEGEYLR